MIFSIALIGLLMRRMIIDDMYHELLFESPAALPVHRRTNAGGTNRHHMPSSVPAISSLQMQDLHVAPVLAVSGSMPTPARPSVFCHDIVSAEAEAVLGKDQAGGAHGSISPPAGSSA